MQHHTRFCFRLSIAGGWLLLLQPSAASATYSIAAVDMSTQEVGGAITSCVGTLDVGIVYGSLPGAGVIHAQALLDQRGRAKARAIELLEDGVDPAQIILEITRRDFDQGFASRQYGIVDLSGRAAGFTGEQAQAYKNDQQGQFGSFAYSVQGNILTGQAVLDQAAEAFQAPACDLAERLMRALEAGAHNGEGDSRCTVDGIPSDSAFIQVDRPGQSEPYLQLDIAGTGPDSPLPQLRMMFDAWRATHPCPMVMPAAGSGGSAGSSSASAGAGGMSLAGASGMAGASAAEAGASAARGGSGGVAGAAGNTASAGQAGATMTVTMTTTTTTTAGSAAPPANAAQRPAPTASAGASASAAGSGTTGTTTSAVSEQPAAASDSGCSATSTVARSQPAHLLAPLGLLLLHRLHRRSQRRRSKGFGIAPGA